MNEDQLEGMINEIDEVVFNHSGMHAKVEIVNRQNNKLIQISISNKALLDIEFRQLDLVESSFHPDNDFPATQ